VETAREKDSLILRREEEIERMKAKMADMAAEFGDMLAGECCGPVCGSLGNCVGRGANASRVAACGSEGDCGSTEACGGRSSSGRCVRCIGAAGNAAHRSSGAAVLPSRPNSPRCRSEIAETLRKMGERVELSAASWEGESASGVPLIRRMEEYAAGGAGGGGSGKP
jgi:hypothetical protein